MTVRRRREGKATAALLLLIAGVAAGGFNYVRNVRLEQAADGGEQAAPRPYASHRSEALEQLRAAYAQEAAALQKRYEAASARRARAGRGDGLIAENVRDFERVQASAGRLRELSAELAEREARVRELDAELALRRGRSQASGFALHWQRLVTI